MALLLASWLFVAKVARMSCLPLGCLSGCSCNGRLEAKISDKLIRKIDVVESLLHNTRVDVDCLREEACAKQVKKAQGYSSTESTPIYCRI